MAVELTAVEIGARAARLLGTRGDWRVEAVFERSFYLRSGDAFVCVGETSIGNGPLNVIVARLPAVATGSSCCIDATTAAVWHVSLSPAFGREGEAPSLPSRPTAPPAPVISLSPFLGGEGQGEGRPIVQVFLWRVATPHRGAGRHARSAGRSEFRASGRPSPSDRSDERSSALSPEAAGERAKCGLLRLALNLGPQESFIHAISDPAPVSLIHRRARIGIETLRSNDFDRAVITLAGLGHGLTPAGDDVLAGALLMLHALERRDQATALADAVRRIAPARTSPLSFALIEPACDGEANAATAEAIAALLAGKPAADVIRPLATIGASSGFDILAGILIVAGL